MTNRSFWALPIGAIAALTWIVLAANSGWYAAQVEAYGEGTSGICLGGPAMVILMMTFFALEWRNSR